jgi:hypothetical protein
VREVWDPESTAIIEAPATGYAKWLLDHPLLTLVSSRPVTVDGVRTRQLTFRVDRDAADAYEDGLPLARNGGYGTRYPWEVVWPGETFTETILEVDGETMLVNAAGAESADERAERDAALDLVLSTMRLPD